MPRMSSVFDEDPSNWPTMEEMLRPKERVHTYYKSGDIVKRLEEQTDFTGERMLEAKKMKGTEEKFRRMVLYGQGASGVKQIKRKKGGPPKGKEQFKCRLPGDYDSIIEKIKNSTHIRVNALVDLDRHTNEVITVLDMLYLFHFDLHMNDVTMQEVAALAITLGCKRGEGHRAVIDFKKLMPQLKKITSTHREEYHSNRKVEEDIMEKRKDERASKYAYQGEETIYGPADEDFLAQAVEKIDAHCKQFRQLQKREFDLLCKKEIHGQLNPAKLRDFFRENLGLKLTRLESIAFVRYGDAFNVGTVPVSFVQEQMKYMSRGIGYSMKVPKAGDDNVSRLDDSTSQGDANYSIGQDSDFTTSAHSHSQASRTANSATGYSMGVSTLTGSSGQRILPMAFLNGMAGRRGKRAMRKFYLDAMLPKEHRDEKLEKTLLLQLDNIIAPDEGKTDVKRSDDPYSLDYDDQSYGMDGEDPLDAEMRISDFTGAFTGSYKYDVDATTDASDRSAVQPFTQGLDGSSISTKSLSTFKSQGSVGSVRYHNEKYQHHLVPTKAKKGKHYVPEKKSDYVMSLEAKVKRNKARDTGQGFGGRSVQSIHDAHNKRLLKAAQDAEDEMSEQAGMAAFAPFDSPLAGSGSRILVPTAMGHRGRAAVGGSSAILRSKTPMALVRPMNDTDTTRERALAERVANQARPQDIFRGDLKRYLQAGLTRLPLDAKSAKLKYHTRWELLYVLAGNMKLRKVWPGKVIAELRKVGEMKPLEGISDPNADTGVWIERRSFEHVLVKKVQVMDVKSTNVLFSALDPRKRGAIAIFELAVQLCPFCGADTLVTDGKKDRGTGAFVVKIKDLPRRIATGFKVTEKTPGTDIVDMLLSVVEMEVFYWAQVKYGEDRPIPGESVKETKMRLMAKKRKQLELQALGVEYVDVKAKLMEEKAQLTRGLCEGAITLLGCSHDGEVRLLELAEAMFGRIAMAESNKQVAFEVKPPEEITSTPVDREEVMEHVRRADKLQSTVESEFRTALYIGKCTELMKKKDPRVKTEGEGDADADADDDESVASLGEISLGSYDSAGGTKISGGVRIPERGQKEAMKRGEKKKRGSLQDGPPPNDEKHIVDH